MNKKILQIFALVLFAWIGFGVVATAQTTQPTACPAGQTCLIVPIPGLGRTVTDPVQYIIGVYNFALSVGGLLAMFLIVYGGIQWAVSTGNPSKISDARDRIINALWGLGLLLGAFIILRTINPDLVNLNLPQLPAIPKLGGSLADIGKLYDAQKQAILDTNAAAGAAAQQQQSTLAELQAAQASGDQLAIAQATVRNIEANLVADQAAAQNLSTLVARDTNACTHYESLVQQGKLDGTISQTTYCNAALAEAKSLAEVKQRIIQDQTDLQAAQETLAEIQGTSI